MDDLKTLFDYKNYDLIIKATEGSLDATSLFYRVSAFLLKNEPLKALDVINQNQQIMEANLASLAQVHVELLCLMNRFDEAREKATYYQSLPYQNQQTEETLQKLPELIRAEEKRNNISSLSDEEIKKALKSEESLKVLGALDAIRDKEIRNYIYDVQSIMINHPSQVVRSFALLLLVQKEYMKEVQFLSYKGNMNVIPGSLKPPFVGKEFNDFAKEINFEVKDPSIGNNCVQLLSSYIIYTYPHPVNFDDINVKEGIIYLSNKYLATPNFFEIDEYCETKHLNKDEFKKTLNEIQTALEDF